MVGEQEADITPSLEEPRPESASLERKVEEKTTLSDVIGGLAKGVLPIAVGACSGYWATQGAGGASLGLALSSMGMFYVSAYSEGRRSDEVAEICYGAGIVIGVSTGIITLLARI